mgnify:FL=1
MFSKPCASAQGRVQCTRAAAQAAALRLLYHDAAKRPQQNHARHGFACYKSRKESAARFQGLPGRPAAKRHFRAIITEMRIFQRAFAKKILAAPPNFCPLSRAKLCKYTNFVGFAPAEAFCVAPRGCNARGAVAPQRRFVCCPCGVFREGAAKGFEEAVCFF